MSPNITPLLPYSPNLNQVGCVRNHSDDNYSNGKILTFPLPPTSAKKFNNIIWTSKLYLICSNRESTKEVKYVCQDNNIIAKLLFPLAISKTYHYCLVMTPNSLFTFKI